MLADKCLARCVLLLLVLQASASAAVLAVARASMHNISSTLCQLRQGRSLELVDISGEGKHFRMWQTETVSSMRLQYSSRPHFSGL